MQACGSLWQLAVVRWGFYGRHHEQVRHRPCPKAENRPAGGRLAGPWRAWPLLFFPEVGKTLIEGNGHGHGTAPFRKAEATQQLQPVAVPGPVEVKQLELDEART